MYEALLAHFGPRHWWPAETPFEVIIGAILTQNTAWSNVEKAIDRLKKAQALTPDGLRRLPSAEFLEAIRPSGYYNIKAARVKAFLDMLSTRYGNDLERFLSLPTDTLRKELLAVPGIGPETADSILLYAAGRPVFVIDAYTVRIMARHGYLAEGTTYGEAQDFFMRHLPRDVPLFNEYHALLVAVGKQYCRPAPRCRGCPLESL
jgi:endonuclease-3 related protein